MKQTLHIVNGDSLTTKLTENYIKGDVAVWREMLCEGKTVVNLASDEFIKTRLSFFKKNYPDHARSYEDKFGSQLAIIAGGDQYKEIVLWFEYDLFCHINMIACISFLRSLELSKNIYLVCSGWIESETQLHGLSELSNKQLLNHYENKVLLDNHDLFLADDLWRIYCGDDHLKFKPSIAKNSNFKYLANCISAHKERFPHQETGLNTLETNMLELIRKYKIKSKHQLCGYMLNYQGYYGYGDIQILKMISRMDSFFTNEDNILALTEKGIAVLEDNLNVRNSMVYQCPLGGTFKYDYSYNSKDHQLSKI
ncbi:DUF1835 domain-containing protein [Dokdonia sp. Hel_I_53]|uniref:DUF1835 domain-containing protein n=1 Tax=Dokdonia sp. Hel_I_53 TaxID=1566287 RepID=UPI00119C4662|nr:DUF1835 domain-containing protein [Dokdonia sp. Hel_I_53]TVZ51704.1 hypothetical protein OD90_0856 [Dokdonia sp. Hel_I_53]